MAQNLNQNAAHKSLGSIEESQQKDSAAEGRIYSPGEEALEGNTGAGGSNANIGAGGEVEGRPESSAGADDLGSGTGEGNATTPRDTTSENESGQTSSQDSSSGQDYVPGARAMD